MAIPLVLLLLPSDYFDSGNSVCLSILVFGQKCYACGMTRATQHLIHLDIKEAYFFNKLSFIVFPILLVVWFQEIIRIYKRIKK